MTLMLYLRILLVFTILCNHQTAFCQKGKKKYKTQAVAPTKDSVPAKKSEYQILFKNINVIPLYTNIEALKLIHKCEEKHDYKQLLPLLEAYVSNFGIQNFYTNTNLLWKLAQLYEINGELEKAKCVFKVVLKHHRGHEIPRILKHYDTLTIKEKDEYVPLKEYYELVEYRKAVDTLRPPQSVFLNTMDLH
jgi:hypothetical protein